MSLNIERPYYLKLDENKPVIEDGCLEDLKDIDLKNQYLVDNPKYKDKFLEMKHSTTARLGIGHCGYRYKNITQLRFRQDHSSAQDSVFSYVSEKFLKDNNLQTVNTLCKDREEFVKRPDKGRIINQEGVDFIKNECIQNPSVQIIIADGLSAAAIEENSIDTLLSIKQGLDNYGIDYGTTFFIKNSRVATEDQVSEILGAKVLCQLIGERPGLISAESMSAYLAYKPEVGMSESRRTVVSNIHKGGTLPVEAGAHIAYLIKKMLELKCSGTDLSL